MSHSMRHAACGIRSSMQPEVPDCCKEVLEGKEPFTFVHERRTTESQSLAEAASR